MKQHPPITDNPKARALIRRAQWKCPYCRLDWRIYADPNGIRMAYRHRNGEICQAQQERAELRKIAAEARRRERGLE